MFQKLLRFFHNPQRNNQRILRHMDGLVRAINHLEPEYMALSDQELSEKTIEFKQSLADGKSLDSLLVPAFATVREASRRILGMRPFDVQLYGGMALHQGMIAEMKTGEGKTLVGTLPVYLNALTGKGVHVVTVNDYLAQRDASEMRPLYEFLGLSVGCIIQDLSHSQRRNAYHSDITYGTNNEFGFDYLKDNMKFTPGDMCQRGFSYAIVDEVDSILIDEARTPLIISGPADEASMLYDKVNDVILNLKPLHYEIDEKNKNVAFTDAGYVEVERITKEAGLVMGTDLFQSDNLMLVHHLNQSLKAHKNFQKDVDYIVKESKVVLIDEFTGRMMKGRRYSDGLHQAIEAKEGVEIEVENQTLASITFQNFFRMYDKLSGMTGTAETEAVEFQDIYKLPVLSIPTNVPVARQDLDDEIFRTFDQKLQVVLRQIKECHDRNQPVLVGTLSIEKSEVFSDALKKLKIPFHVLNARHHEQEAKIIAQAGAPGAITIATNMAGRGTDIKLGGNLDVMLTNALRDVEDEAERAEIETSVRKKHAEQEEIVRKSGGLFVLGTERNENRRIDNQLRGRSGRQGDPGASKFFISLQDDLMRIFGPNLKMLDYSLRKTDESDSEPIAHPWVTRTIEKSQQRVEAQHFDTRKHLLKYADVLNSQRTAVYDERQALMYSDDVHDRVLHITEYVIQDVVQNALDQKKSADQWNWDFLSQEISAIFGVTIDFEGQDRESAQNAVTKIQHMVNEKMADFDENWGIEMRVRMEKSLILKILDQTWIAHLNAMDHLRSGIHLQAYGQKDPLNEYRHEAFVMFKSMKNHWYRNFLTMYFHANPDHVDVYEDEDEDMEALLKKWSYQHESLDHEDGDELDNKDSSEDSGQYIDYRKILDELLSKDSEDGDFMPKDWENMWSDDKETGKRSEGKRSSGQRTSDHQKEQKTTRPSSVKTTAKPARSGMGLGRKSIESTDRTKIVNSKSTKTFGERKSKSTGEASGARRVGSNAQKSHELGDQQVRKSMPLGTRSRRESYDQDEKWGASSQEQAKTKQIKRRAPSKRGPYVPKNTLDHEIFDGGFGQSSGRGGRSSQGRAYGRTAEAGQSERSSGRGDGSSSGRSSAYGYESGGQSSGRGGRSSQGRAYGRTAETGQSERSSGRGDGSSSGRSSTYGYESGGESSGRGGRSSQGRYGRTAETGQSERSSGRGNGSSSGRSSGRGNGSNRKSPNRGDSRKVDSRRTEIPLAKQFYSSRMTENREKPEGSTRPTRQEGQNRAGMGQRTRESLGGKARSGQSHGQMPVTGRGLFGKKPGSKTRMKPKDRNPKM